MVIHGLCAFFASNSRFMRLFQAAFDTCLDSPFFASLSVHGLHFMVYAPKRCNENFMQLSPYWAVALTLLHRSQAATHFCTSLVLYPREWYLREAAFGVGLAP